jgi:alkylhydroperoxidase family enzyme
VGSWAGVAAEKIDALGQHATSPLYSDAERVALEYADAMTIGGREVGDELFGRLRHHWSDDQIVELTATIAWENASARFNRTLRVPSPKLWRR